MIVLSQRKTLSKRDARWENRVFEDQRQDLNSQRLWWDTIYFRAGILLPSPSPYC